MRVEMELELTMRTLKKFKESELLFNDDETREILLVFFPSFKEDINSATMTIELKSMAQALLLEAIDASYKIGFIQGLWKSTLNPRAPFRKIIENLVTSLAPHMFHHATTKDLRKVKIYQMVIDILRRNFKSTVHGMLYGYAQTKPLLIPNYNATNNTRVWV